MTSQQTQLFAWGNRAPSRGECCQCNHGPLPLFRFNVIVEDAFTHRPHTQLLCRTCAEALIMSLIGHSVETTPQVELDRLTFLPSSDPGWPAVEQVA